MSSAGVWFFLSSRAREQPDGGLLDKLVFGVGVGHGVDVFYSNKNSFISNALR